MRFAACGFAIFFASVVCAESKLDYWNTQRRGANCFNANIDEQWFADAKSAGIQFVRLTFSKWKGADRDFLIGDADKFERIPAADLAKLRQALDWAQKHEISVVVVPLSLPGSRWRQQNAGKFDKRLWTDDAYHAQSSEFWKQLASSLRDHPAVVGYEVLNEPAPERAVGLNDEWSADLDAFAARVKGSPTDLNVLYRRVVSAIREVDPATPIVLSCGFYGFAGAMTSLTPLDDPRTIYSFHTYEPYAFTNFKMNAKRFTYPGDVNTGIEVLKWDRDRIRWHVSRVSEWAKQNRVGSNRIFVGEFGCDRRVPGCVDYLADSISVFNEFGWHWAFYGFREDEWDALDYEIGTRPLGAKYWEARERGENPAPPRGDNPIWRVVQSGLLGR